MYTVRLVAEKCIPPHVGGESPGEPHIGPPAYTGVVFYSGHVYSR